MFVLWNSSCMNHVSDFCVMHAVPVFFASFVNTDRSRQHTPSNRPLHAGSPNNLGCCYVMFPFSETSVLYSESMSLKFDRETTLFSDPPNLSSEAGALMTVRPCVLPSSSSSSNPPPKTPNSRFHRPAVSASPSSWRMRATLKVWY